MLTGKFFDYVHVPRTGGTWTADVLKRHGPGEWGLKGMLPKHGDVGLLPPGDRPVLAAVREPRSWYESWYGWFQRLYEDRDYAGGLGRSMFERAVDVRTRAWRTHFERGGTFEEALPWLTWHEAWSNHVIAVLRPGTHSRRIRVIHYENLREELVAALGDLTPGVPNRLRSEIIGSERLFQGKPSGREWTPWMIRLVQERDGELAAKYGYSL
jgi:hypothetical protein